MVRRFGGKIVSITPPAKTKPTKAEMAEITKRVKVYSRNLLPGAGVANAEEAFKAFILERAGVKDVKDIAKQDWEARSIRDRKAAQFYEERRSVGGMGRTADKGRN